MRTPPAAQNKRNTRQIYYLAVFPHAINTTGRERFLLKEWPVLFLGILFYWQKRCPAHEITMLIIIDNLISSVLKSEVKTFREEPHMLLEEREVYTISEAARILKVSEATIRRRIKEKKIVASRDGRIMRILGKELRRYLEYKPEV
jgi:excisionase family DNA binding protein